MSYLYSHGRVATVPREFSATGQTGEATEGRRFAVSFNAHLPKTMTISSTAPFHERPRGGGRVPILGARASLEEDFVGSAPEESFYELLGISESVGATEIKQAYKQMARKYHPDVSPPDRMEENTRRFIRVQEAYETLSDPRRRALYDMNLNKGLHIAFSPRRRCREVHEQKSEWRNRWEGQLEGLKRRSCTKVSGRNMSWGSRMRQQSNSNPEEQV